VGDTFTIDGGRKVYVKEVSATGKIMKVDWAEGFEFTGSSQYDPVLYPEDGGKRVPIDTGSYSGNGKDYSTIRFIIKQVEKIDNMDNQLKIKV
jgi:hypothetical protein